MTLGENLRAMRHSRNLTQKQAADRLGLTRQALSSYESNRTRPDIDMLTRLAALYGTNLESIIYGMTPGLKVRRRINTAAIALLVLLTLLTAISTSFLWRANCIFPLGTGQNMHITEEILNAHVRLCDAWETTDHILLVAAPVGCFLLMLLIVVEKYRVRTGRKLLYLAALVAGLLLPGFVFGLLDPVFPVINYLITPGSAIIRILVLFLIFLAVEFLIHRREQRHL